MEHYEQDQLILDFPFLRNYPNLYSIIMKHLRSLTTKNVKCEHFVLIIIPDIFRILNLILFSDNY